MDAMILAAGRGERLRPLTDKTPKPLLWAGDRSLIEHLLRALAHAGMRQIVINYSHLGDQITNQLGDGSDYGVSIRYSDESAGALETGGGILNALPLLASDPFLVVNSDIWTDLPFRSLPTAITGLAHLILVDNPPHHPDGDFTLAENGAVGVDDGIRLTFSGVGIYRHRLFESCRKGAFRLAPLLVAAAREQQVSGQHYQGKWIDVGNAQRLDELNRYLKDYGASTAT